MPVLMIVGIVVGGVTVMSVGSVDFAFVQSLTILPLNYIPPTNPLVTLLPIKSYRRFFTHKGSSAAGLAGNGS